IPIPQPPGQLTVEITIGKGSGFTEDPDLGLQIDSLLQAVLFKLEPPTQSGSRPLTWIAGYPDPFYTVRDFFDWVWGLMSYDFTTDTSRRTMRAARAVAQPDTFFLLVHGTGSHMPYGLRVLNQGLYAFPPDTFEVNDWVKEARPVSFPASIAAVAENGGALDFYSFTLAGPDSTRVRAKLSGATGDLDLWLGLPTTTPLQTAIARGESPAANDSIVHKLGPGTYVIGVFEFAMTGTAYTLTLDVAPPAANATGMAPATTAPPKWRRSLELRRREDPARAEPRVQVPPGSLFRIPPG
ncbi:MAG: PPC domain-containing protein, partial [Gemmatimonadetes bacterium]|nr:PPC domain-containing protein [Gemmatimonadota bacterium]